MDRNNHIVRPDNLFAEWKKESTESSIYHHFQAQARMHPGRTAVTVGDYNASYEKLDGAANRLARAISARRGKAQ
jgi:acyl-CoA synthetase (AMP-forming)/AMP-acid ligase II